MSRQPSLRPKSSIPGYPDAMYNLAAVTTLTQLESRVGLADEKHDQRVFRVKHRLGLIKQAEENADEPEEESEDLQYLRFLSTSTDSSATTDPSPEPATPPEPSPSECSPVLSSPKCSEPWRWDMQPVQNIHSRPYQSYQPHTGYQAMAFPRPHLEPMALACQLKCTDNGPSMTAHEQPCYYYVGTDSGADSGKSSGLPVGLMQQQPVIGSGVSVSLMSDYALHVPEQHAIYPPPATSWSYRCD
ncbi:hypothetical protein ASPACDRAFT_38011 [Aspergillus aculeatus ATCC 16872]|uniref:Uncharacterized protein n=1 Tax=Aspergillus aculeatus (strain ATCC 16872 / CBS 172.66 / WB 5094) TaxID=690307 RepID=A0A1L9X7M8_ASPA1|nr:uncharacterized protein ASPACDRAFT_38011 [Aspergillus aculeatus ATCC 16872]OJK04453.1 hypothetical protein ASPACDRAFT_38011 [Aspergillus aculeatus ATCC 16872]